jgi:hypothetical protein
MIPAVTKEEFLRAVRDGVHDAMWQMMTNATSMPCHDFFDHVREGVENAIYEASRPKRAPSEREVDTSPERQQIIKMLEEADGTPMRAHDIAQILGTKASSVTKLLRKMAKKGMVVRRSYGKYAPRSVLN